MFNLFRCSVSIKPSYRIASIKQLTRGPAIGLFYCSFVKHSFVQHLPLLKAHMFFFSFFEYKMF